MSEGKAKFYASKDKDGKISRALDVFYNPIMKFNRDVNILVLNNLGMKDLLMTDIMAGSGVRSIRFLTELKKGVLKCLAVNDYDKNFVKLFKKNLKVNKIGAKFKIGKNVLIHTEDANLFLLKYNGFDYIDIDPFGSPNDFLNSATVRLSRGGILSVTGTDTASLSGTFPDTCKRIYWAKPLYTNLMHETGLRILIRKVQLIAAQHDKALIPVYSYFKDHYNRIFFKCIKGRLEVDKLIKQHKYVLYCANCMSFNISDCNYMICDECSKQLKRDVLMDYAGPMWVGDLYDPVLAQKVFSDTCIKDLTSEQKNFLETIMNESKLHFFGFYNIHELCKHYKKDIPNFEALTKKIVEKGFVVSRTHFTLLGLKTNIPLDELIKLI